MLNKQEPNTKPHIVVVGGGAGGLELTTRLGDYFGRKGLARVSLIDSQVSHVWKPLLHEVAAGVLDSSADNVSYLMHARQHHFTFHYGVMHDLDREKREIILAPMVDELGEEIMAQHNIAYDYLVFAVGSLSNDFGTEGVKEHCFFMDHRTEAERFHEKLMTSCIRADHQRWQGFDADIDVTVAIVGAGATGVELSAELHHSIKQLQAYGLENFGNEHLYITLLEAGPRILPALPEYISSTAHRELEKLGVTVLAGSTVAKVTREGMITTEGKLIPASIKVWAAGIKAPDFLSQIDGLETNRINQLVVNSTLQTTNDERIFAIADCCACPQEGSEYTVPPRAQSANQMATHTFKNFKRMFAKTPLLAFVYKDKGSLVSISSFGAVGGLLGKIFHKDGFKVEGWTARFLYASLYRLHLAALHGWWRTILLMLAGQIGRVVKPKMKLH